MVAVLRAPDHGGPGAAPLEPTPTVDDLDEVVERFRASGAAARVELAVAPGARSLPAPVPAPVQAPVLRVAQESLTNAAHYARGASRVSVELERCDGLAVLTVCDSGGRPGHAPGHAPDHASGPSGAGRWGGGFGVAGMRERVAALEAARRLRPDVAPATSACPG